MSNSNYILSQKKNLTAARLKATLEEALEKCFPGILEIENKHDPRQLRVFLGELNVFDLFLKTARTIEVYGARKHWEMWIETTIRNEIAHKIGGKLGCECLDERWEPKPYKWATFKEWLPTYGLGSLPRLVEELLKDLPPQLCTVERLKKEYVFTNGMLHLMQEIALGDVKNVVQIIDNPERQAAFSMLQGADFLSVSQTGQVQTSPKAEVICDRLKREFNQPTPKTVGQE